jgi:hypothetical protein
MKILVEHDEHGNIRSISAPPDPAGEVRIAPAPRPGYKITEAEAAHVKDERDYERLQEIKRFYRIETGPKGDRLVRK